MCQGLYVISLEYMAVKTTALTSPAKLCGGGGVKVYEGMTRIDLLPVPC